MVCSWEFLLSLLGFVLTDGGPADPFRDFLVCSAGMAFVYASLAEMASMAPTAGGQYHRVSEFAPARIQKPINYAVSTYTHTATALAPSC